MREHPSKVIVIGAGSAFDTQYTNSSFLIQNVDRKECVLIDCGYNVFSKLMKEYKGFIPDINHVFITHMDDDHIGSLKSFLYYRYFVCQKKTIVHIPQQIFEEMWRFLNEVGYEMIGSERVPADIVDLDEITINHTVRTFQNVAIQCFPSGVHHIPSFGYAISFRPPMYLPNNLIGYLIITGDTKAHQRIEQAVDIEHSQNTLIFHDYSFWDAPSRQVHACKSDMKIEYTKKFLERTIVYHNTRSAGILEDAVIRLEMENKNPRFVINDEDAIEFARSQGILASDIVFDS